MIAEAIRNGDMRRYAKEIEGDLRRVERVNAVAVPVLVTRPISFCAGLWDVTLGHHVGIDLPAHAGVDCRLRARKREPGALAHENPELR